MGALPWEGFAFPNVSVALSRQLPEMQVSLVRRRQQSPGRTTPQPVTSIFREDYVPDSDGSAGNNTKNDQYCTWQCTEPYQLRNCNRCTRRSYRYR